MVLHTFLAIVNSTIFTAKPSSHVTRRDVESVKDQSSSDRHRGAAQPQEDLYEQFFLRMESAAA